MQAIKNISIRGIDYNKLQTSEEVLWLQGKINEAHNQILEFYDEKVQETIGDAVRTDATADAIVNKPFTEVYEEDFLDRININHDEEELVETPDRNDDNKNDEDDEAEESEDTEEETEREFE